MKLEFAGYEVQKIIHFLLPEKDEAHLVEHFDGGTIDLKIKFVIDDSEGWKGKQAIESGPNPEGETGGFLTLTNWNQGRFMTAEPFDLMARDGFDYHILVSVAHNNGVYDTTIQFMKVLEPSLGRAEIRKEEASHE